MVPASLEKFGHLCMCCVSIPLNEPANVNSNLTEWSVKSTLTVMTILTQPHLPADPTDASAWLAYGRAWATAYGSPPGIPRAARTHSAPAKHFSHKAIPELTLTMHAYREATPGPRWQALARATWPAYARWFRARPASDQPTYAECRDALRRHLPALLPTWEHLTELAVAATGTTHEDAGRLLSLWRPTPFVTGCSQVALTDPEPVLLRSYDYDPALFEGVVASTNYSGTRRVMGTSDCLWGLLDGINEDGLAVSLTFGGRPGSGVGFGIPLVLRALLEECGDVTEAVARVRTLPVAQAYNLTFVDAAGTVATVFVAPGEEVITSRQPVATNHRLDVVEYPADAARLRSRERHDLLTRLVNEGATRREVVGAFLREPVRSSLFSAGFGSLFMAEFLPKEGSVTYRWPGQTWTRRFEDPDASITVEVPSAEVPSGCRGPRPGNGSNRHRSAGRNGRT